MTPRQTHFYVYRVDIWRLATPLGTDVVTHSRVAVSVPCLYSATREAEIASQLGRVPEHFPLILDRFGFEISVDVRDGDNLQLVAVPHAAPNLGAWFAVTGSPELHAGRANRLQVTVTRAVKPVGAP